MRSFTRRSAPRWSMLVLLATGGAGLAGLGCGSVAPVEPQGQTVTDPSQIYTRLTLNYNAVNLSNDTTTSPAYYSVQLVATPRDALGNPMTDLPAPTFQSLDTARVRVTPTGLLRATAVTGGTPVTVIASLTQGLVTHADTARINVTNLASPPTLAALSVQPLDSTVRAVEVAQPTSIANVTWNWGLAIVNVGTGGPLVPPGGARATDPLGNPITGLVIEYRSLDPTVGTVDRWGGNGPLYRPGQLRLVARTMAYGIVKEDTAVFTVTMPAWQNLSILPAADGTPTFVPNEVRVAPSGQVFVANYTDDTVDVSFDGDAHMVPPTDDVCSYFSYDLEDPVDGLFAYFPVPHSVSCSVGDMLLIPISHDPIWGLLGLPTKFGSLVSLQARRFSEAGTYTFHSARTGISGRIIVSAEAPGD